MITTEDRVRMRQIAESNLTDGNFEALTVGMVRSLAKSKKLTPEQSEAYVLGFFDVLMSKLLDARNKLLAEIRRV